MQTFDIDLLRSFDANDDDEVDKAEYILGMLRYMQLVDKAKVKLYADQFDTHDIDGSGTLTMDDVALIADELRRKADEPRPSYDPGGGGPNNNNRPATTSTITSPTAPQDDDDGASSSGSEISVLGVTATYVTTSPVFEEHKDVAL